MGALSRLFFFSALPLPFLKSLLLSGNTRVLQIYSDFVLPNDMELPIC